MVEQNISGTSNVQPSTWRKDTQANVSGGRYDPRIAALAKELEEKREHRINRQKALEVAAMVYGNSQRKVKMDKENADLAMAIIVGMARGFEIYLKE